MTKLLINNIYVGFSGLLSWKIAGISMGRNISTLLADFFLYSFKNEFLGKLTKDGKRKLTWKLNLSFLYINDLFL